VRPESQPPGDHPSATALANSLGFTRVRALWQMRRSLFAPLPEVATPTDVHLRDFQPGADDAAWLALNAKAFANHPEQGRWTIDDLRIRMAEPWFDPAGFLLAERAGELIGFHWTKIHGSAGEQHHHDPIGEVYVLGVDPGAQSAGLGAALTVAGLAYLRRRGLSQVMLYVDESNTAATRLYGKLGFVRWTTDVSFARSNP
jgi:mycothiol synthase